LQPQNVDCSPDIGAAASRDGHIGGGHISRETGKAYGKEGGTGSLVFALVIIAVGMGLAAYSGLLQKICGSADKKAQYQRVPTTGKPSLSSHIHCLFSHAVNCPFTFGCLIHCSTDDGEAQSLMDWENDDWDEDGGWNSDEEQGQGSWVGDSGPPSSTPSKEKPKTAKLGSKKLGAAKSKAGVD
jgi:hypothetical protein